MCSTWSCYCIYTWKCSCEGARAGHKVGVLSSLFLVVFLGFCFCRFYLIYLFFSSVVANDQFVHWMTISNGPSRAWTFRRISARPCCRHGFCSVQQGRICPGWTRKTYGRRYNIVALNCFIVCKFMHYCTYDLVAFILDTTLLHWCDDFIFWKQSYLSRMNTQNLWKKIQHCCTQLFYCMQIYALLHIRSCCIYFRYDLVALMWRFYFLEAVFESKIKLWYRIRWIYMGNQDRLLLSLSMACRDSSFRSVDSVQGCNLTSKKIIGSRP